MIYVNYNGSRIAKTRSNFTNCVQIDRSALKMPKLPKIGEIVEWLFWTGYKCNGEIYRKTKEHIYVWLYE